MTLVEGEDGELLISIPIAAKQKKLPEYYCFANDRHSGSFFLKMGAALFAVGHLVHVGLELGREVGDSSFEFRASKLQRSYLPDRVLPRGGRVGGELPPRRDPGLPRHPALLHLPPALHDLQVLQRHRQPQQGTGAFRTHALHRGIALLLALHHQGTLRPNRLFYYNRLLYE